MVVVIERWCTVWLLFLFILLYGFYYLIKMWVGFWVFCCGWLVLVVVGGDCVGFVLFLLIVFIVGEWLLGYGIIVLLCQSLGNCFWCKEFNLWLLVIFDLVYVCLDISCWFEYCCINCMLLL